MINVAICDDVVSTTGKIETMLQNIAKRNFMPVDTDVFWKGEHLVDSVEMGNSFDIIFLDIEMGQEDGITVAREMIRIHHSAKKNRRKSEQRTDICFCGNGRIYL